jgi:hypothetical protein
LSNNAFENELSFDTIEKGFYSTYKEKKNLVINSEEEWSELWQEMNSNDENKSNAIPSINFNEEQVIAVFQGEKNSSGYEISIKKIVETNDSIKVFVEETIPGENCETLTVITSPYHIVKIKKPLIEKEISFEEKQSTTSCS